MKVSEIDKDTILCQLREEESALSQEELAYIDVLKDAAIDYVKSETGINGIDESDENGRKLDDHEDLTIAVLVLISDMYDNRQMTVGKGNPNRTVDTILGMHRFNLVPKEGG